MVSWVGFRSNFFLALRNILGLRRRLGNCTQYIYRVYFIRKIDGWMRL